MCLCNIRLVYMCCACVMWLSTFVSVTDSVSVSTHVRMMLRKGTHVQKTSQCLLVSLISRLFSYSWEESLHGARAKLRWTVHVHKWLAHTHPKITLSLFHGLVKFLSFYVSSTYVEHSVIVVQNWCQLCAWWSLLSYMTVVCNPSVFPVGSFMAGWPFAHTVESSSWTSAFYLLEVASVVMVGLAFYLLILLLRGLAANRQKQKQNWTSCTVDPCIFIYLSVHVFDKYSFSFLQLAMQM